MLSSLDEDDDDDVEREREREGEAASAAAARGDEGRGDPASDVVRLRFLPAFEWKATGEFVAVDASSSSALSSSMYGNRPRPTSSVSSRTLEAAANCTLCPEDGSSLASSPPINLCRSPVAASAEDIGSPITVSSFLRLSPFLLPFSSAASARGRTIEGVARNISRNSSVVRNPRSVQTQINWVFSSPLVKPYGQQIYLDKRYIWSTDTTSQ